MASNDAVIKKNCCKLASPVGMESSQLTLVGAIIDDPVVDDGDDDNWDDVEEEDVGLLATVKVIMLLCWWVFKCALKLHANANLLSQTLQTWGLSPIQKREKRKRETFSKNV